MRPRNRLAVAGNFAQIGVRQARTCSVVSQISCWMIPGGNRYSL
jgi:hypothetical protein